MHQPLRFRAHRILKNRQLKLEECVNPHSLLKFFFIEIICSKFCLLTVLCDSAAKLMNRADEIRRCGNIVILNQKSNKRDYKRGWGGGRGRDCLFFGEWPGVNYVELLEQFIHAPSGAHFTIIKKVEQFCLKIRDGRETLFRNFVKRSGENSV